MILLYQSILETRRISNLYGSSPSTIPLRYGGGFQILSNLCKTGGELLKSLTSLWLSEFFGVKVGLIFEWDVAVVAPFSLIILDSVFDSIGGAQ